MTENAQKRALRKYRERLTDQGLARFEVLGLSADRDLVRSLAKRLAEKGPDASRIRTTLRRTISDAPSKKGGVLEALRRSPLAGADIRVTRPVPAARKVDL